MIIYGSTMSPFVRKVVAVAISKGVEFDLKAVRFNDEDPGYRAASPLVKMPAIDDNGYRLADSSAICHYLDAAYEGPTLVPADARARGRTVWWDEYADGVLFECGRKLFFNRVVAPRFLEREGDTALADRAEAEELPPILDYLESEMPDADGWLVGEAMTLADIAVASPFANLDHAAAAIDWARYPRLDAWTKKMLALPCLKDTVKREQGFLDKLGHTVAGRV